ncbi:MAG: hypothetical protein AAB250_11705, partial [Bdellovibrionota bacterium]
DEDAYKFLLEVICGLRSPLLGETEVYGQFKTTVAQLAIPATPWGGLLARTFKNLFEDAKRIRQAHLEELGSQSYGSVLRREIKGLSNVHILGAGQLVREILPWIAKDGIAITIHCRDEAKVTRELGDIAEKVKIVSLAMKADLGGADALVVAAPVAASFIESWMRGPSRPALAVDLRANSAVDVPGGFTKVLDLGQILSRLTANKDLLQARKRAALEAIESAVAARARHVEYRPFGWDDVCA